jgi:hypothetical protein
MTMNDELQTRTERLLRLAREKAHEYAQRPGVMAIAITGSLARGTAWEGSDVDLWGFTEGDEEGFEDGMVDGLYWEIDLKPVSWLEVDDDDWLRPPAIDGGEGITAVEALWGCAIVRDDDGTLTQVKTRVGTLVSDSVWLNRRADHFVHYGLGALDGLAYADPLTAIVKAREIIIRYGIAVYWMRRGKLLSSAMRIPERLKDEPKIYALFHAIFCLGGQEAMEQFLDAYRALPASIQDATRADIEYGVMAMMRIGVYDGALVYIRQIMAEHPLEDVMPVLGLSHDVEGQKRAILAQARELLELCDLTSPRTPLHPMEKG